MLWTHVMSCLVCCQLSLQIFQMLQFPLNAIDVLTPFSAFRKMKPLCLRNSHSAPVVLGIVVQSLTFQCFQVLTYIAG